MHVDLRVSGYISVCVDIDISCQGVLEKKAPLRWLDLEWKGACLLCWQDMGVLHDRWPEQGREDPPHVWLFQSAHLCTTGLIPRTLRWFLLSTLTLCDTMLCDRNATRAEDPGPLFLCWKGQHACGICHRTQVCSPIQKGVESSSATLPNV